MRRDFTPSTGSEDFSFMSKEVPGCYLLIGNDGGDGDGGCPVHHPEYDFNDDALTWGGPVLRPGGGAGTRPSRAVNVRQPHGAPGR